jgi:hypothetical protein
LFFGPLLFLYRKQELLANNCLVVSLFVNSMGLKFLFDALVFSIT